MAKAPQSAKTAVVLGAGVGGLAAAERLRANLPSSDRVVLMDRSFTGSLGLSSMRVLAGWRTPEEVRTAPSAATLPGVSLVTGEVGRVDTEARTVHYRRNGATGSPVAVDYDALVIALGAGLDSTAIPGLAAALSSGVAAEFYTPDGAAELHRRVDALVSGRIVVLIPSMPFKCPPAPYEAAFLIADQLGAKFTGAGGKIRVDVITAEPRPIPIVDAHVGDALVGMLDDRGIGFQPGKTTGAVDADAGTVTFTDGSTEPFDLLAVVPPHVSAAAAVLDGSNGLANPGGWIPVDPATLATEAPGVWAVGDNTALTLANGMGLPKAGVFAEAEAAAAADQLTRYLGYDAPDTRFTGDGGCLLVVGGGLAAKVAGHFLATPAPQVSLSEPNSAFHAEKAQQERDWLARWSGL